MKEINVNITNLKLNKAYATYLSRLIKLVREQQGDIELICALERNLINDGKLLPKKSDLKLFF